MQKTSADSSSIIVYYRTSYFVYLSCYIMLCCFMLCYKTEILAVRSLTLGGAQVVGSDAVRVLGVLLTPNLSLDKHVTVVNAKCFFQLRQLRRVRRSLDDVSAATLVHAFVTSRVDYTAAVS